MVKGKIYEYNFSGCRGRYIGETKNSVMRRFNEHFKELKKLSLIVDDSVLKHVLTCRDPETGRLRHIDYPEINVIATVDGDSDNIKQ